jgi:hypothetical protein
VPRPLLISFPRKCRLLLFSAALKSSLRHHMLSHRITIKPTAGVDESEVHVKA